MQVTLGYSASISIVLTIKTIIALQVYAYV